MNDQYGQYVNLLRNELVPALGCTEPIAIAYAAAIATEVLGHVPENIIVACSGNIIKNVKSVTVPNSGGQKGIEAAAILGALGGRYDKKLEVLNSITEEQIVQCKYLVKQGICRVELISRSPGLHIRLTGKNGDDEAVVEIKDAHTNVLQILKNGTVIYAKPQSMEDADEISPGDFLTVSGILQFAKTVHMDDVRDVLDQQIQYNTSISEEGLSHPYGVSVGRLLLDMCGNDIKGRAKAKAAAGSDARMSGCSLPVVINSGSGNQGITVSLPVIEYAHELNVSREELYRALIISNLVALRQKVRIGKLSAYCGAVSAACGSGAAITYLYGGSEQQIADTITNTLANISGIVCDGAKPSCAAKIASAVDAAIMAHHLAMNHSVFASGDGIVKQDVEHTIDSVGRLAKDGMRQTDEEVLRIMVCDG